MCKHGEDRAPDEGEQMKDNAIRENMAWHLHRETAGAELKKTLRPEETNFQFHRKERAK
jgi:hypothetical protein